MLARWTKFFGFPDRPVPPTILVKPPSSRVAMLIAVAPAVTVDFTLAFHRISSVVPGGMSNFQFRMVLAPESALAGEAEAHPDGVIVQPWHGSSNPYPAVQTSSSAGTVSHTETFHHVLVDETFFTKIEYVISSSG